MPAPRIPRTVAARGKPKPNLHRRVQHLAFIRQLPCVACGKAAPSEAAHVRTGTDSGVGMKPGDRYAVPLCAAAMRNSIVLASSPSGPRSASTLSMWRCACGRYRPIYRPASVPFFARGNRSILRRHMAESRTVLRGQILSRARTVPRNCTECSNPMM